MRHDEKSAAEALIHYVHEPGKGVKNQRGGAESDLETTIAGR